MPTLIEMVRASVWGLPAKAPVPAAETPAEPEAPATQDAQPQGAQDDGPDEPHEFRAALKDAGVKVHHKLSAAKVTELYHAFTRSGLSGEEWEVLSDADKAKYFEAK